MSIMVNNNFEAIDCATNVRLLVGPSPGPVFQVPENLGSGCLPGDEQHFRQVVCLATR